MDVIMEIKNPEARRRIAITMFEVMPSVVAIRFRTGVKRLVGKKVSYQMCHFYTKENEDSVPIPSSAETVIWRNEAIKKKD